MSQEDALRELIKQLRKFDERMDNLFFPNREVTGDQGQRPPVIVRPEMPELPDQPSRPPIVVQMPGQDEEVTAPYIYDSVYGLDPSIGSTKEFEFTDAKIIGKTAEYFEIRVTEAAFLTIWVEGNERKIPRKLAAGKWYDIKQPGMERIRVELDSASSADLQLFTSATTPLTTLSGMPGSMVTSGLVDEVFDNVNYGTDTVATAGTAQALNSGTSLPIPPGAELTIVAKEGNTGKIYVGDTNVDTSTGFPLDPQSGVSIKISDVSLMYIDADNDGDGANWIVEAS